MAVLISVLVFVFFGIVALVVIIGVLRSALGPIEEQLRRIADELMLRNTVDDEPAAVADR